MKRDRISTVSRQSAGRGPDKSRPFSAAELADRLDRVRAVMSQKALDACLVFSPENIYYLTGLDHYGFFSPHILIVPLKEEMQLVLRAMEEATFRAQIENAVFHGHSDGETPAKKAAQVIKKMGLAGARVGIEKHALFTPIGLWETLARELPGAAWEDASNLIDRLRMIKSPSEQEYIRQASRISGAMMQAARDTAREGVSEAEIAAEVLRAMVLAGGEPPGFGPFIRATPSMPQEHVTWGNYRLQRTDMLFVELSGCCRRYHAPMGRLFFIGELPEGTEKIARVCEDAFDAVVATIKPGITADDAYQAWQTVVDRAGLTHYRRHHCGYMVGVGFPPSWVGGSGVLSLRCNGSQVLAAGMSFHMLSWLVGTGIGDYLITDTVILTEEGGRALRRFPVTPQVL
jgi:Xaa-Pro dipeptidase